MVRSHADQVHQAQQQQERRGEQHGGLGQSKVAIDQAEQHRAGTVAGVKTHRCAPHRRLPRYERRDFFEPLFERRIARLECLASVGEPKVRGAKREDDRGAGGDEQGGEGGHGGAYELAAIVHRGARRTLALVKLAAFHLARHVRSVERERVASA